MGVWGTGLFSDDVACDVKEYYMNCLRKEMTADEAEAAAVEYFQEELADEDDGPVVVLALADTAWRVGRLSDNLKNAAIEIIDSGKDLNRWEAEEASLLKKRQNVLFKLKEKLLSTQPPEKRIYKKKPYICQWEIGDVFAYQLKSKEAELNNILDTWAVLQKVNQADNLMEGLSPVVTVRFTNNIKCPDINSLSLPCVRINRYLGYKWSYRLHILLNSARTEFFKSLIYLGNKPLSLPVDDYPHDNNKGYTITIPKFFEEAVINSYLHFGLSEKLK